MTPIHKLERALPSLRMRDWRGGRRNGTALCPSHDDKSPSLSVGRKVGTHTLRHSAARHWLSSGIPINVVSRWLGHASLQTTLIYLEILPDPLGEMGRVP